MSYRVLPSINGCLTKRGFEYNTTLHPAEEYGTTVNSSRRLTGGVSILWHLTIASVELVLGCACGGIIPGNLQPKPSFLPND
jgi:hypothetical protein